MSVKIYCGDDYIVCAHPHYKATAGKYVAETLPSLNERTYGWTGKELRRPERQSCVFLSVIASELPTVPVGSKVLTYGVNNTCSISIDKKECFVVHRNNIMLVLKEEEKDALCKKRSALQK